MVMDAPVSVTPEVAEGPIGYCPRRGRAPRGRARLRAALRALPAPHLRLHPRHGQGPRPRRGHHAGGLHLRAAPHARDRPPDRLQALDLRDRQERLHRPVPPLPARRGGLDGRRATASATPTTAASWPATRPRRRRRRQAAARPPVRRVRRPLRLAPRDPRPARVRGPVLPRDRRPHGPQPPRRREHALPRPQAPGRGVRRARHRPALRAHPVDHRRRRRRRARHARPAPARAPHLALPAVPPAWRWPPGSTSRRSRARPSAARSSASPGSCRSRPSCARASSASRWSRCPSRWPPRGRRPWRSPPRCSSPASARASPRT